MREIQFMADNGLLPRHEDESEPDRRGQGASPRPSASPEPEQASKVAFLGMVKGVAMGFGLKAGKWVWEKGEALTDMLTDDGH